MKDKNLIKYSISLLVVAILFIAIGGISLSRNLNREDGRVIRDFGITETVNQISDENLNLKTKNKELTELNTNLVKENEVLNGEKVRLSEELEAYKLYYAYKNGETNDSYEEYVQKINALDITEELKKQLIE